MKRLTFSFLLMVLMVSGLLAQTHIVFPPGAQSGVIDVTQAPYNADNTGATDATAAIQAALDAYPNGNRIIYLPNGVYLISNTLRWPAGTSGGNSYKRTVLQGEHRDSTIIRLAASATGYQDSLNRKTMVYMGPAPAQRFHNEIRNVTLDANTGNPGVSGVQFMSNNAGRLDQVLIISQDGRGVVGLDLYHAPEIGPALITNLEVDGFQYGIRANFDVNSLTFEDITLRNQTVYGLYNRAQQINIRKLTSYNEVTAMFNEKDSGGQLVISEATLRGTGAASSKPGILNQKGLYIRNSTITGYAKAIDNDDKGRECGDFTDTTIVEHMATNCSLGPSELFFCEHPASLFLPIKESPVLPYEDTSVWVSIEDYGAIGDDGLDDAAALQSAIDAGATTIYIPGGKQFTFTTDVYLYGPLQRLIGLRGRINGTATFHVVDSTGSDADTLVVERFSVPVSASLKLIHESSRTLVFSDVMDWELEGNGSGDFFINNVVCKAIEFKNPAQHIWCRQLNVEESTTKLTNHGATLWILGLKTEREGVIIETNSEGSTEVIGGLIFATGAAKTMPMFRSIDANFTAVGVKQLSFNNALYNNYLEETKAGCTDSLLPDDLPRGELWLATTASIGDNYALNQLISSYTAQQSGNEAQKIVDGNVNDSSRWSASGGFPQSTVIELGTALMVNHAKLYPYQARAYQYTLAVSDDDVTYTTVVDRSSNTTGESVLADNFAPVSARFVKLTVTGASGYTGSWTAINELSLFQLCCGDTTSSGQAAFEGPHYIPGRIETEHFDQGGEGVAYHDSDASNNGGSYRRSEGVDIEDVTGGGYNSGWSVNGEWLEYTVSLVKGGTYDLRARVASNSGSAGDLRFILDGDTLGTIDVTSTGGWQTFATQTLSDLAISGGSNQVLRIDIIGGNLNFDWFEFVSVDEVALRVNFEPTGYATPAGYLPDHGDAYGDRGNGYSYGWDAAQYQTRFRDVAGEPFVLQTLNHMQLGGSRTWEIGLPNGDYEVDLYLGDADNTDQTNTVSIEGSVQTDPDGEDHFDAYLDVAATVSDGRLTIAPATGGDNAKLNYVVIRPAGSTSRLAASTPTKPTPAWTLYPNPTTGEVRLQWDVAPRLGAEVKVLNSAGQVLIQHRLPHAASLTLDLSALPAGLYLVWVNGETQRLLKR